MVLVDERPYIIAASRERRLYLLYLMLYI